jgi:triacylglycerol esterase/lipase EstA (alpha/beta hydrolase family)
MRLACTLLLAVAAAVCTLNLTFYLRRIRRPGRAPGASAACDDRPAALPLLTCSVAFLGECAAMIATLGCSLWPPHQRVPRAPRRDRPPLLLVHGYGQRAGSFACMARRLRADGWSWVAAVEYAGCFGDVRRSVARLGARVDDLRRMAGADRVDIVAHGMGGLITRAYLRAGGASAVRRLITLGTPHQGTEQRLLADLVDPMARQLRPGSALLADLGRADPVPDQVEVVSIYSLFDAVVLPSRNAYYPGAVNVEIDAVGHAALLFSGRVYQLICENLV